MTPEDELGFASVKEAQKQRELFGEESTPFQLSNLLTEEREF